MGCKTDANCEKKIKIGIVGYGNLGKACEKIALSDDKIELVGGIFKKKRRKITVRNDGVCARRYIRFRY